MKVSQALREKLHELDSEFKIDSDDAATRKATGLALAEEKLTLDEYQKLVADPKAEEANDFVKAQKETNDLLKSVLASILPKKEETEEKSEEETEEKGKTAPVEKSQEKKEAPEWHKKLKSMMGVEPATDESGNVRVKGAWERFSETKSAPTYAETTWKSGGRHPFAGKPVKDFGRTLPGLSERDKALGSIWAWFQVASVTPKMAGSAMRAFEVADQTTKEMLFYLCDKGEWDASRENGSNHVCDSRKGYPGGLKALIDDSTSGGLEAAPIVFDDMVIQTPLLHGELFPMVNTIPLDRGRRVEGVSTGTVTGSWGGVDNSSISLFNTNSYVSAFDTTIFRWEGAITIGLDFLSDTPIDFGNHVTEQYGQRMLEDLDDVIAAGNGTTQPEGIVTKSGTTSVTFSSTTSLSNYESLRFGVAKPEHNGGLASTAVFCGTETSYQRAIGIPVGASDARRLFGGTTVGGTDSYDGYSIMQRKYAINESLANTQIFYAVLGRYRMYRRKGLAIRTSTEGDTLIRNNEMLIVAMARYGGQLERGACAAVTSDAPS